MRDLARWLFLLLAATALQVQAAPPLRVVSLLPSLTETVCVLGHCDALVAVDDFSDWPVQVQQLPHVGGLEDANIERIVALAPDLVLLSASSRAKSRLEALHIRVLALEPKTIADVEAALVQVATVFGETDVAHRLWSLIEDGIAAAAHSVPAARKGTRVYFEVDAGPYAAGPQSHIGELFTRLGVVNIIPAALGSVPKVNPEFVVRADPQLIIIAARDANDLRSRPGWDRISAVRTGRICALDAQQLDVVSRPGPRLAQAARVLAGCIAQ